MIIEINPLDTLFFRDGKPFSMGEETWADAIFPPSPSVIYGALRSAYFAENIEEFQQLKRDNKLDIKGEDKTTNLQINGIYLKIGEDSYLPVPLDLVKEKNDNDNNVFMLHLGDFPSYVITNVNDKIENIISHTELEIENVKDGLIRLSAFEKYLNLQNDNKKISIHLLSDYILSEPKVGIARSSHTHSTELGKLYRVDMKRLENKSNDKLSIVVEYENLDIPEKSLLKLGGEGKAASYKKYDEHIKINFPEFDEKEKQFKLVLTTPAIFENGWLPKWIDKDSVEGEYNGLKLKLLTAAIGKPVHIGGFDMKKRMPKPMYKAVPAGSVYYFKLQNGTMNEVKNQFHNQNISDTYSKQGFGHCYVGKA